MERSRRIVYLATENNPKCCLGLSEVLEDGWNIKLVIAYVQSKADHKHDSFHQRVMQMARYYLQEHFPKSYRLLRRIIKPRHHSIRNMESICSYYHIPYKCTADKSLQSLKVDIAKISPEVILSNGWQYKITIDVFQMANLIALNCHSSYLPEYRGGNVTYAPLINKETQSGVTVHQIIDKFDAGEILAQERISIDSDETPQSLNMKRSQITGKVLIKALEVAGHPELYKSNPKSPFYFRCNYATYKYYKCINFFRGLIDMAPKRYEPQERYDI